MESFNKMKKNKTLIILALCFMGLSPLTVVSADILPENLYTGSSAFYVCALNQDDILTLNLTHTGIGNFSLYLLNARPIIDDINMGAIVAQGLDIYYNATNTQIYYVQVYLSDNGPDIFEITVRVNDVNIDLIRYYIPQIPGYPLEFLILSISIGFGFIYLIRKRKMRIE